MTKTTLFNDLTNKLVFSLINSMMCDIEQWRVHLIDTQEQFNNLCLELEKYPVIGIDTEFDWRVTYFPKLCLIQIATEKENYLIDPLQINDLSSLKNILENEKIVKIFHAATYDVKILFQEINAKTNHIFDTQLASEFLGLKQQPSLNDVLSWLSFAELDKSAKLSDWCKRPLSEKQTQYALDDVRFLIPTYLKLKEKLENTRRFNWFYEESNQRYNNDFYIEPSLETSYLRLKRHKNYFGEHLIYLKELALWRETKAVQLNKPPRHILKDISLYQMAYRPVFSQEKLKNRYYQINSKAFNFYSDEIIELLSQIKNDIENKKYTINNERIIYKKYDKPLLDEYQFDSLYEYVKNYCTEKSIISQLVATKSDLKKFMFDPNNEKLRQGWRYQFIGKSLIEKYITAES